MPISAENDALRKVASAKEKENIATLIPRPKKGKGFSMQEAMGLQNDYKLYTMLRVSFFPLITAKCLLTIGSARFLVLHTRHALTIVCRGVSNPRKLLRKL